MFCFSKIKSKQIEHNIHEVERIEEYLFELIEEATISTLTPKEITHEQF